MGGVCCRPEVRHASPSPRPKARNCMLNLFVNPVQPIDFDGEVNLFHFILLRSVGKGAFGKVRSPTADPPWYPALTPVTFLWPRRLQ